MTETVHMHYGILPNFLTQQRASVKVAVIATSMYQSLTNPHILELDSFIRTVPLNKFCSPGQGQLCSRRKRIVFTLRAFKHSSVAIWNNSPADIRSCTSAC